MKLHQMMTILWGEQFLKNFFEWIEDVLIGTVTKAWLYHFLHDGDGKFVFHRDRFKSDYRRAILTLGNSSEGKVMRFLNKDTKTTVALRIPHGTIIFLPRVVAGADKDLGGMY